MEWCDDFDYCDLPLAPTSEEAAEWYVRLRDEKLPLAKRLTYLCWLRASPVHIAEMLRMRNLGRRLRGTPLPHL